MFLEIFHLVLGDFSSIIEKEYKRKNKSSRQIHNQKPDELDISHRKL